MKKYPASFEFANDNHLYQIMVLLCDSPFQRLRGLLARESLLSDSVLWLRPCSSIHTCFMQRPIDVIYLNREKCIVKTVSNLKPWRFSASSGSESVLELASGLIATIGVDVGDYFKCNY